MPEPKKETVSPVVQGPVKKGENDSPKPENLSATPAASPPAKKPLGQKEIIPFEWKLVGESHGVILTLFKAVDRLEVEAQEERVRKDGYYGNLRILDANAKIKQHKPVSMGLKAKKKTTKSGRVPRASKAKSKLPARFVSIKRTAKPEAPAKETKRKTKTAKATVKKTKKKAAPKKTKAVRKKASLSEPKKKTTKKTKKVTKKTTKKAAKKVAKKRKKK